ncbi:MAG: hypothetical protein HWN51_01050, partial [Desulfobacterales bacterium]|nr:hypothetical protein [Desulfobacterales bacterium]
YPINSTEEGIEILTGMKALCAVHEKPWLRFTPGHCDQFLHLGLKEDVYPHGVLVEGIGWGWYVLDIDGVWKVLPECGYFLEAGTVDKAVKDGRATIVIQHWRHPATENIFPNVRILTEPSRRRPFLFDKGLWKGECLRCGTCCSVPRRRSGRPCEYLKFVAKSQE